jgi:ADP-heptose:LPS heptosyltransferase
MFHPEEIIHELYPFTGTDVQSLRERFNLSSGYIVINPNASDLRIERRWPMEKFSTLIDRMNAAFPEKKIVLIGSRSEVPVSEFVISGLKKKESVVDTSGKLSLSELITLIGGSSFMVTNDTGPMHISFALKKRTIALFGPASPVQFGNHPQAVSVYKKTPCSPCVHSSVKPPCNGDNICMKNISVEEVFERIPDT